MVSLRRIVRVSVVSVLLASLAVIGPELMASGTASASPSNCYPIGSAGCRYSSTTTLVRSQVRVTYGRERHEHLSVRVSGSKGPATGRVTIAGVCTKALSPAGWVFCTLANKQLKVGRHILKATYAGSSMYKASSDSVVVIVIT